MNWTTVSSTRCNAPLAAAAWRPASSAAPASSPTRSLIVAINAAMSRDEIAVWSIEARIAPTAVTLRFLRLADGGGDAVGRHGGLVGKAAHLLRDHLEAAPALADACRLDAGIEREQSGLAGDPGDQRRDGFNATGVAGEPLGIVDALNRDRVGAAGDLSGGHRIVALSAEPAMAVAGWSTRWPTRSSEGAVPLLVARR